MKKTTFILVFIVSNICCSFSQNRIEQYGSEDFDYTLILRPDLSYSLCSYEEIAKDIINKNELTSGKWIIKSDTLVLTDTIFPQGNINRRSYKLVKVNEYEMINLSLKFIPKYDSLRIVGMKDLENSWIFRGEIIDGKMNGMKIDLKQNLVFRLKEGKIVEIHKIE
jgi:hypothetical protein